MEVEINKGVSKTEVCIKLEKVAQMDEFRYRMLRENAIPGVIACVRGKVNDSTTYTYDVTGMQSVAVRFEGKKLRKVEIQKLYEDVIRTLLRAEDYFLDKNCFLVSKEFVQYSKGLEGYQLLYCPELRVDIKKQLEDFTEYVLNNVEYSDQQAVTMIYEVFRMIRDDRTTILEVLTFIKEGRKQCNMVKEPEMQKMQPQPVVTPMPSNPVMGANPVIGMEQKKGLENGAMIRQESQTNGMVQNPEEEKVGEVRVTRKKVFFCGAAVITGISGFLAMYWMGLLFMAHTNRLDMSKLVGSGLVIGAVVYYACYRIMEIKEEPKEETVEKKAKKQPVPVMQNVPPVQPVPAMQNMPPVQPMPAMQNMSPVQPVPPMQNMQPAQPIPPIPNISPIESVQPLHTTQQIQEAQCQPSYRLVSSKPKSKEQLILNKFPFVLGKCHEQVDGVIYSDAVSKVHAEFIEKQGVLYVADMSSTNGTYVNHKRITSNQWVSLRNGDHIQIADKEYRLCS